MCVSCSVSSVDFSWILCGPFHILVGRCCGFCQTFSKPVLTSSGICLSFRICIGSFQMLCWFVSNVFGTFPGTYTVVGLLSMLCRCCQTIWSVSDMCLTFSSFVRNGVRSCSSLSDVLECVSDIVWPSQRFRLPSRRFVWPCRTCFETFRMCCICVSDTCLIASILFRCASNVGRWFVWTCRKICRTISDICLMWFESFRPRFSTCWICSN